MKFKHALFIFAITLSLPLISTAQNDTSLLKKNVLTLGLNYQSRLHYFGRTHSLRSSGLFPTIGFQLKEGFYVNSNFILVNNSLSSLSDTGTAIEGGFRFPQARKYGKDKERIEFITILHLNVKELSGNKRAAHGRVFSVCTRVRRKGSLIVAIGMGQKITQLKNAMS